jgi:hypothetical protein
MVAAKFESDVHVSGRNVQRNGDAGNWRDRARRKCSVIARRISTGLPHHSRATFFQRLWHLGSEPGPVARAFVADPFIHRTLWLARQKRGLSVGRTPWSAPDPPVRLWCVLYPSDTIPDQ